MMPGQDTTVKRRRNWIYWLAPIAVVIVGLGLAIALWFAGGRAQLRRALAKMEAAGIPTDIGELMPPPVPDSKNAALIYEKAWSLAGYTPPEITELGRKLRGIPPGQWQEAEKHQLTEYMRSAGQAVAFAKQAARLEQCSFLAPKAHAPPSPRMSDFIALTKLMTLDALDKLGAGDFEGAADSALAGMRISRHCGSDPTLISKLTEVACYVMSAKALDSILQYGDPTTEELERLLARLGRAAPNTTMSSTWKAEICLGLDSYEMMARSKMSLKDMADIYAATGGSPPKRFLWVPWACVIDRDKAMFIETMTKYVELADRPLYQTTTEVTKAASRLENAPFWICPAAKTNTDVYPKAFGHAWEAEAQHQLLRLSVAAMIFEKKHGSFPAGLNELSPEIIPKVPIDPFSGVEHIYRRDDGGFAVYSLGRDMQDDKGVPRQAGSDKGDIVFRYEGVK